MVKNVVYEKYTKYNATSDKVWSLTKAYEDVLQILLPKPCHLLENYCISKYCSKI